MGPGVRVESLPSARFSLAPNICTTIEKIAGPMAIEDLLNN